MKIKLLFCLIFATSLSFAQNPTNVEHNFGTFPGFSSEINSTVIQPDGKILVVGNFAYYKAADQMGIVRLNADGSKDETFDLGTGFDGSVYAIALQPDGKILVGGRFTKFQGVSQNGLIRLNADGSKDTSFDIGIGFVDNTADFHNEPPVCSIAVQADGKIIVGGDFIGYQGTTENYFIRLNADGSKDTAFNIGTIFKDTVYCVALQSDGKIMLAGDQMLIRLNIDGSKDTTFKTGSGFDYDVYSVVLQNDGKILAAGLFDNYDGKPQDSLIRLNADGTKDTSFNVGSFYINSVSTIAVQPDGKVIVGGTFVSYKGIAQTHLLRINTDGSKDTSFNIGTGFNDGNGYIVNSISIQSDGKIIAGGNFNQYQEISEKYLIRINPDGSKDTSFHQGAGFDNTVYSTSLQTDGKILVGGKFTAYLEGSQKRLIRFNADGSKDNSFNIGKGFNGSVFSTAQQSDGKILVGGIFTTYQDVNQNYLTRLNADGGRDVSFDIKTGFNGNVRDVTMQPDGKIIVNGEFTTYQGSGQKRLIRLNADGTKDSSFNIGTGFDGSVLAIALQPDKKLIVGGNFKNYQGASQNYLIRLNPDGSKDTSFDIGTGFGSQYTLGTIQTIVLQPNGKILIGGEFKYYQGKNYNYLIRLNSDGSIDSSFNIGTGFDYYVYSIALQDDGKIIVAGGFTHYQEYYLYDRIARLNSDGSKDISFNVGALFLLNAWRDLYDSIDYIPSVYSLSLQSDGKLIVGGNFTRYKGDNSSAFLIRLKGGYDETVLSATITPTNVSCPDSSDGSASILVSNDKRPYSYLWSNGATTETITGLNADTYSCTVTDTDLKTVSKSVIISTATDIQNPTIIAPEAVTVSTTSFCGATGVVLGIPLTTDNCTVSSVTNNAPTTFPIGDTTVTWTVKDAGNNTATAQQIVTVKDITLPTIIAPAAITINAGSDCKARGVILGTPTSADNCTVSSVKNNAPASYPIGNTTVTWTVTDASNNIATTTQIVTVKDITLPTIIAPPTVIVNADSNGTATGITLGTPITADNCTVSSVTNNAPATYPKGNTTITWTVKDASNNIATATQIVTVKDFILLTITAPLNKTVNITTSNCTAKGVVLGTPVTTYNCNVSSITNNAPPEFPLGNTTVTWTVKDVCNNTATAMQIITVKETVLPTIIAPPTVIVNADSNGTASGVALGTPITADNCSVSSVTNNAPNTFPLGNTIITWTVKDASNNIATATQIVTVKNTVSTTLIPDINFENKLISLGIDSGKADGKVLTSTISSLTSLDVSSASITNMTGIQDFVALKNLKCNINLITSMDLTKNSALNSLDCSYNKGLISFDLSKNTVLNSLDCSYNTRLISIDLSQNIALTSLKSNGNSKLLVLDVSKNLALTELECNYANLTTLDVSKNVNLKRLFCSSNKLEKLNLKNGNNVNFLNNYINFQYNPNLSCIQVDNVAYSNANWLKAKDATAYYSDNCSSQNILISSEFEDKLIALGIDKDGKNGSVLSAEIFNIKSIDLSNSGITDLSGIEYFKSLETLICKGNLISAIDLSNNTSLKYLDCSNNPLTVLNVYKNMLLTELYCDGIVTIINKTNSTKGSNNSLTVLDLSNNLLLTKLSCSNNQILSLDVSKNTFLTDINCSNNQLTYLNLNNGNNTNMLNVNFKSNSSLSCIKVDDPVYSNANWSAAKDITTIYSKTTCTLGLANSIFNNTTLYPNPTKGQLHINNVVLEKVTVYNTLGKLIKTTSFTSGSNDNTINLAGLPKGIYYLYLQSQGITTTRKIAVE